MAVMDGLGYLLLQVLASLLGSVLLYLLYTLVWVPYSWVRYFRHQGIPGEPFVPILGQLPDINKSREETSNNYHVYEDNLRQKHGPVFFFCKGPEFRLYFHDVAVLQQFANNHASLGKLPVAKAASVLTMVRKSFFIEDSPEWRRQRKKYNPAFQHSELDAMFGKMQDCTKSCIDKWMMYDQIDNSKQSTMDLNFSDEMSRLTFEIVVAAAFGARTSHSKDVEEVANLVLNIVDIVQHHFLCGRAFIPGASWFLSKISTPVRKYHAYGKDFLIDTLRRATKEHGEKNSKGQSLMEVMRNHVAEDPEEAVNNGLALMLAGHETTANAICFVIYLLDMHPQWWDLLREEVVAVCGTDVPPSMTQAWKELPICASIITETLRLYPIVPELSRCVLKPLEVNCGGKCIQLPVGALVIASISSGHRDPRFWENPQAFNPARFLSDRTPLKHMQASYAPFSLGGRNCIGRYFAHLEARLILSMLVQRLNLKISPTYRHHPFFAITLRPKYGLPVKANRLTPKELEYWTERAAGTTREMRLEKAKRLGFSLQIDNSGRLSSNKGREQKIDCEKEK